MTLREAVVNYQYGERIKAFLISAAGLLAELEHFKQEELAPAVRLYKSYLDQVRGEIRLVRNITGMPGLAEVEAKLKEATWEVHINRRDEASVRLGEAISLTTTATVKAAELLKKEGLL